MNESFDCIGLVERLKLVVIKQMTMSVTAEVDYLHIHILSASERNTVLSSISKDTAFLEWLVREQEHLKRENGNGMEKYLLLASRQCSKMNYIHNECCFQWDLECLIKSNQIKSNQNILSNITYPIYMWIPLYPFILVSEGRSKQSLSQPNSHFISIYILFMINVLS